MLCARNLVSFVISIFFISGVALAATPEKTAKEGLLSLGAPLKTFQLRGERARGELVISADSAGSVGNNSVGVGSVTGGIANAQSITNNSGVTTVFENTGNNSLLQNTTSIYVSAK